MNIIVKLKNICISQTEIIKTKKILIMTDNGKSDNIGCPRSKILRSVPSNRKDGSR
jgi:hypothetical protein